MGVVILILLFKSYLPAFFTRQRDLGAQMATAHIFRQVKAKGSINVVLDGEKITLIEAPKEEIKEKPKRRKK